MVIPASVAWGLAYMALGLWRAGTIPFGFGLFSTLSLVVFLLNGRFQLFAWSQFVLVLWLPFLLQWSLGGFVNGSAVMIWAVLSPMGALTFLGLRASIPWFFAFVSLTLVSALLDASLPPPEVVLAPRIRTLFFALNLTTVSAFFFVLVQHLGRMQLAAHAQSERLLLSILPEHVAVRLKRDTTLIADGFDDVTILFADLVGFTQLSQRTSPERLVSLLDVIFTRFDALAEEHNLEKIKTIGDAYMVAGGIPERRSDHLDAMLQMALHMREAIAVMAKDLGEPLSVRIGIHCGAAVAGVIGRKKFIYDLWGDTVNTASRMESHGVPDGIHVTNDVKKRAPLQYVFEDRGVITIKGKGEMRTWLLTGQRS